MANKSILHIFNQYLNFKFDSLNIFANLIEFFNHEK